MSGVVTFSDISRSLLLLHYLESSLNSLLDPLKYSAHKTTSLASGDSTVNATLLPY